MRRVLRCCGPAGVAHIGCSIDTASPELFEKIRRCARLDIILENIRLIYKTKEHFGTKSPQLSSRLVAMHNIHEFPSVVKMVGELGVADVVVGELVGYNLTRGQSLANDPLMAEWVLEAEAEARKWVMTDEPLPVCVECPLYGWEPMDSCRPNAGTDSTTSSIPSVNERDVRISNLAAELNRIYDSHGWKALLIYYKVRNKLFPEDSRARSIPGCERLKPYPLKSQ